MYCTYRCTQEGENINVTNLMSVFEIIGSIAFAISGSMLAIKKEMDLVRHSDSRHCHICGWRCHPRHRHWEHPACHVSESEMYSNFIHYCCGCIYHLENPQPPYGYRKIARRTDIMYHNLLFLSDTLGLAAFTILGMETTIRFLNTDQFLLIALWV